MITWGCGHAGVQKEHGDLAVADITYGLQRLRDNQNTRACFWACCYCPNASPRFDAVRQYQRHLEQCHEEVQVDREGRPLPCSLCQHGVWPASPHRLCHGPGYIVPSALCTVFADL